MTQTQRNRLKTQHSFATIHATDPRRSGQALKRQQYIEELLSVARLLNICDLTTAAVGNSGFRNLLTVDRVFVGYVLRPHDAGDDNLAHPRS